MEIVNYNGTSLAFIGDAWMSLKVRMHVLEKGYQRPGELQRRCSRWECAHARAEMLRQLEEEAFFDEDEQEIIRRGRNATIHTKAKNADIMTYRHATALEALIGYLYLYHKSERLELLWQAMVRIGETV